MLEAGLEVLAGDQGCRVGEPANHELVNSTQVVLHVFTDGVAVSSIPFSYVLGCIEAGFHTQARVNIVDQTEQKGSQAQSEGCLPG